MKTYYMVVYGIKNIVNGKMYIGLTQRTMELRKEEHFRAFKNETHMSPKLYRAFKKYGFDNFIWGIIDFADNRKDLDNKEKYWINRFNTIEEGYNIATGGEGGDTWSKLSKEKKELASKQLSVSNKKNWNSNTKRRESASKRMSGKNNNMYERPVYDVWVEKYGKEEADKRMKLRNRKASEKLKGENNPFYGKTHDNETKKKIGKLYGKENELKNMFNEDKYTLSDFMKRFNCSKILLVKYLQKEKLLPKYLQLKNETILSKSLIKENIK